MKLTCYALHDVIPKIIPAPLERDWMNQFSSRHPYRCLPLAIGNCYGWQLLLRESVKVTWTGGLGKEDVIVETVGYTATSNFKMGVVTFDVPIIFRTERGYNLMVTGPTNYFKDGAAPMAAIVESDWLCYTFTMNYQMTRPGTVVWEKDEPYCQVCVVPSMIQESVEPELRRISDNPGMQEELRILTELRTGFRGKQDAGDREANLEGWQKIYFRGQHYDGRKEPNHKVKMRLHEVKDCRS